MEIVGAKQSPDGVHVFELLPWWKFVGIFFAGFVISSWPGLCLFMLDSTPEIFFSPAIIIAHFLLIPLTFLLGLMTYFAFIGTRLIMGPDRVEYYTFGYTIASDWNNVARVGPIPGVFGEALILREPVTRLSGWYQTLLALRGPLFLLALLIGRYSPMPNRATSNVIQVSPFSAAWRRDTIGKLVARYAPQVFDAKRIPAASPAQSNSLYEKLARESQPRPWPAVAGFAAYAALLWVSVALLARAQMSNVKATLTGHTAAITSIAYRGDGKLLASGGDDKTVRLWDVVTGKEKSLLRGHTDMVRAVAFRPEGTVLASCSFDNSVKVWDVASGKEVATLKGHDVAISVAFSPDGKLLASAGSSVARRSEKAHPALLLWDATAFTNQSQPVAQLGSAFSIVDGVAFSPDSKMLAVGGDNGSVEIWDVAGREIKVTIPADGSDDSMQSLIYSPDGTRLARLSRGGQIHMYETSAYQALGNLSIAAGFLSIAFSPDSRFLAVGCRDNKVRLISLTSGETHVAFRLHNAEVTAVAFSPDGKTVASADGAISVYNRFNIFVWDVSDLLAKSLQH